MLRVKPVYALVLGVAMAAVAQAQQPMPPGMLQGPMMQAPPMQGPMMMGGPAMGGPMLQGSPMVAPALFHNGQINGNSVQQAGFGDYCGDCGVCGDCGCGQGHQGYGCGACGGVGCGGCCPPPGCPVIFNHEVEASFLYMDIDGTAAAGQLDAPALPVAALYLSDDAGLDDDLTVIPRVWLHAQKCEWGIGARLWYLGESQSNFTPLNLLNLNLVGNYSMERIHAWTGDGEVTYNWHRSAGHTYGLFGRSSFQLGVGVRHAEYENDSLILANASLGDAIAQSSGVAKVDFDGNGITTGARGTVHLRGCVSFFWGVRGSVIWGDLTTLTQTAASAIYQDDPAAGAINSAGTVTEEELFIGEVQLGIQWEHHLHCIPATCFFRVAGEYQHWNIDSQAFSATDSIVQVDVLPAGEVVIASSQARAEAPRLDMYGLSIAAGITW